MSASRTIRINLLPHREARKARQKKLFTTAVVGSVVLALAVIGAGQGLIGHLSDQQAARNDFLKREIGQLDSQIKEIQALKQKTDALLNRKRVVEELQNNRASLVYLFDEMARRMPNGVYLTNLQQQGNKLTLQGMAQSSARVSALMRNLQESPRFDTPTLIEVRTVVQGNQRVSQFNLTVNQINPGAATP